MIEKLHFLNALPLPCPHADDKPIVTRDESMAPPQSSPQCIVFGR